MATPVAPKSHAVKAVVATRRRVVGRCTPEAVEQQLEDDCEPSDSRTSEAWLVERTRQGEVEAFGVLVRRYERRVQRVVTRFVHDAGTAEDLTQDAFVRAFARIEQFDTSRRFGPWLFRIAVNGALDHLRRKKRRGWLGLFGDAPRGYDPPEADPRRQIDTVAEVRHVVDQLPEKYRAVLVLRDLENFSTSEIAAVLGRKEATIRWRLAEARQRFHELWTRRMLQDDVDSSESIATGTK